MEPNEQARTKKNIRPTISAVLDDRTLIELVYEPETRRTNFAVYTDGQWTVLAHMDLGGERLLPFSPENNLIKNAAVHLPSVPEEYADEGMLLSLGSRRNTASPTRTHGGEDIKRGFDECWRPDPFPSQRFCE
jgi:hypothetical protein